MRDYFYHKLIEFSQLIINIYLNGDWLTNGDAAWKKDTTRLYSKIVVCVERANSELLRWPKRFNGRFALRASSV